MSTEKIFLDHGISYVFYLFISIRGYGIVQWVRNEKITTKTNETGFEFS